MKLYKFLSENKREFIMSKQLLRCGTSIGANISEGQYAQSRPDFISKMNIALKEAAETSYWLQLLHQTEFLTNEQFESIFADCEELISLLTSIVKTSKETLNS